MTPTTDDLAAARDGTTANIDGVDATVALTITLDSDALDALPFDLPPSRHARELASDRILSAYGIHTSFGDYTVREITDDHRDQGKTFRVFCQTSAGDLQ